MGKAVLMKVKGIVKLNGKKTSPGKIIQDGDTITTGPNSFAGFMFIEDKSIMKVQADTSWYNASIEEVKEHMDGNPGGGGGTMGSSKSGGSTDKKGDSFVIKQFTGVAGVKG